MFVEVRDTPEVLLRELREPPLSNLISHYTVQPVNFEKDPYYYHGFTKGPPGEQYHKPAYKKPYYNKYQGSNNAEPKTQEEGKNEASSTGFNRDTMKHHEHQQQQQPYKGPNKMFKNNTVEEDNEFEVVKEKQRKEKQQF